MTSINCDPTSIVLPNITPYFCSQTLLSLHTVAATAAGTWAITARAWQCDTDLLEMEPQAIKNCLLSRHYDNSWEAYSCARNYKEHQCHPYKRPHWTVASGALTKFHPLFGGGKITLYQPRVFNDL